MGGKAKADAKGKAKAEKKEKKKEEDPADKVPKVEQPDRAENDAKMQKVQDEITALQKQQQRMTEKIQQHSGGKDEFHKEQAEVRSELDVISAKMDALMDKKNELK